jgi:hypothetical protein
MLDAVTRISFTPQRSVYWVIGVHASGFAALLACWLADVSGSVHLLLFMILLAVWQQSLRAAYRSVNLSYTLNDGWGIWDRQGRYVSVAILSSSVLCSLGVVLHFSRFGSQAYEYAAIPKDSVSSDDFRRLVVLLRISYKGYDDGR